MSDMMADFASFGGRQGAFFRDGAFLRDGAYSRETESSDRLAVLADFGSNPGALTARFYLPPDLPPGAPLVVVLHGCTQNAAGYDHRAGWSTLADEAGFALLYPEQSRLNNPNLCFNWFRPGDARRDAGEALSIRQMIDALGQVHAIDSARVFITGLSAGGAMTSVMLAAYPEVFAGGAIIAGLAYGCASTVPEAFDCMRGQGAASDEELWALLREASDHGGPWPRIAIWQGSADHTVAPSNAEDIAAQWRHVHHLGETPTREEMLGVRARRTWCNGAGEAVIELNTVASMGHGTPLGDGLGVPGPYMLDVGISSTREIARFWGLADAPQTRAALPARPVAPLAPAARRRPRAVTGQDAAPAASPAAVPATSRAKTYGTGPALQPPGADAFSVKKTIEDALRAAGLMR
ncbi:PHB depolymerase family esterase [Ancylobacter sp. VKM B-3255]|uniref:PHB depolymerase family esterase n=2 Tax=Ancylobacter radicis TaxID=2836179 RepID=A0ABS5R5K9_9HYPH|nr:PHB depolymerase family esterase [Ancylobacter radicis]MBS9476948.1 PHB depolymerase family esterase [Ancylobacter radicis]